MKFVLEKKEKKWLRCAGKNKKGRSQHTGCVSELERKWCMLWRRAGAVVAILFNRVLLRRLFLILSGLVRVGYFAGVSDSLFKYARSSIPTEIYKSGSVE